MSAGFVPWAIEALIASTLLMLLVLVLRKPVRRAFGPEIAYALWLLPVLRLLLPPLPQSWHEAVAVPVAKASEQIVILVAEPLGGGAAAPEVHASLLGPALILLWVAGAAAFMLWHSVAHARFCRRMLADSSGEAVTGGIHVIETSAAKGPLAFGIWRRYVAFPRDFAERYDADERDLALAHELGHHARGDLIANWAALVVLALHWFNPIAWRAFRAFRADQEIANDARVLAGRDAVTRHLYACAIVKAAHGGAVSAACHLHTIEDLKGRLKMLTTNRTSRTRLASGAGVLALIAAIGLGATASGTQAAERVRAKVEKATGVELARLTLPAAFQSAPVPPTPPEAPGAMPAPPAPPAPPPLDPEGKPMKHRYKVMVVDGDKTVMEHDMGDGPMPPMVETRMIRRVVRRDKDGHVTTEDWGPNMPPMPPIPEVSSMNCHDGGDGTPVIHDEKGGKKRIIICTNRIERMAQHGAEMARHGAEMAVNARDIERRAYGQALEGLRSKRSTIAGNTSMGEEGRRAALEAIDQAIRELEGDLAAAN